MGIAAPDSFPFSASGCRNRTLTFYLAPVRLELSKLQFINLLGNIHLNAVLFKLDIHNFIFFDSAFQRTAALFDFFGKGAVSVGFSLIFVIAAVIFGFIFKDQKDRIG